MQIVAASFERRSGRFGRFRVLIKTAIALGLLAWLVASFGAARLADQFAHAQPSFVAAAALTVIGNLLLRTWRWRLLFARVARPGVWPAFVSIAGSYLFNNVLPARPGDVLRVFIVCALAPLGKARVLASVIVERLFDLLFAACLLLIATRFEALPKWLDWGAVLVGAGGIGAVALLGYGPSRELATRSFKAVVGLKLVPERLRVWGAYNAAAFLAAFADLLRPQVTVRFLAVTAILWMTEGLVVLFCARALSIDVSFVQTMIVMLVAVFASLVPMGPGQFGIFEGAVVAGMTALGFAAEAALALALLWHALLLLETSSLGAICLLAERRALGSLSLIRAPSRAVAR